MRHLSRKSLSLDVKFRSLGSNRSKCKKGPEGPLKSLRKMQASGGRGFLIGALSLEAGAVGGALGRGVAVDEFDDRHGGVVALAEARLHDAQITTIALRVTR